MRRLILFTAAAPAGLAVGLTAWLLAGAAGAGLSELADLEGRVQALKAPAQQGDRRRASASQALANTPLLLVTSGPGAVQAPAVRVDGVSVTRRRVAALLSIGGAPSQWMSVGEERDGVTLQAVFGSSVMIETVLGPMEVALGQGTSEPHALAAQTDVDQIPPGFRPPVAPASAP